VSFSQQNNRRRATRRAEDLTETDSKRSQAFSFGRTRYASSGPRRLFVPQKSPLSPVFESESARQRGMLRVV
jgi:hypothetical protein